MLDAMPLPGTPKDEAERRRLWLLIPLRARAAIRRMHRQFGHPAVSVLCQILRAARAPLDYIKAARHMKCEGCEENKQKPQSAKVALPKDYVFNREIGVDVLEIKDSSGHRYSCLNVIDMGTTFQQVIVVVDGGGMPTSQQCVDAFVDRWVSWAGWPKTTVFVRGPQNLSLIHS